MNFLEELTAEWYGYKRFFVRTNIKYGKNEKGRGGHTGEMDVVAYNPETSELTHIECSGDSDTWANREIRFKRKFFTAGKNYNKIFGFPFKSIEKKAIVGFGKPRQGVDFGEGVKIVLVPDFIKEINDELGKKDLLRDAIPEIYPLLRAMQYSVFYSNKEADRDASVGEPERV